MSWDPTRPGNTRAARTMRDRVLREEPTCRAAGCDRLATEDDHVVPWSQREKTGLTISEWHARSNHQGLCESHHREKTQTESNANRPDALRRRAPRAHPGGGTLSPPRRRTPSA